MPPTPHPGPDGERWRRLETICDAALKLEPAERAAYLDAACAGDAALRAEIEDLLAHEYTAERFLDASPAAALPPTGASLVGQQLGGYRITQRLGEGGMGVVYRAHDTRLDRDVALKLVADGHITVDGGSRRLQHEARAAARLNHPNICTVHEVTTLDGVTGIAMELIEGTSLRSTLESGPLAPDRVARIGQQIADALDHAHANGVIHRDLKSSNIMLRPDGRVKVIDFGIADRMVRPGDETETARSRASGGFMGTLAYAAPELLQGAAPDARSDIWSLGVVLYEMTAGRLPFEGRTESDLAAAILRDPWPPLPAATPPSLARIIERCLSRMPHDRPARAGEVASALDVASVAGRTGATGTRRRFAAVAATVAGMLAIALPAIYLRNNDGPSAGEPVRFENPIQVTNAVGVEESPAWSHDGRMLAYSASPTGDLNGTWDIWVAQLGAGAPINRTAGFEGRNLFPSWSPDGSHIAFWSSRDGGGCYVMPALAGAPRRMAATGNLQSAAPQWSVDGAELSCVTGNNTGEALDAGRLTVSFPGGEPRRRASLPGRAVRLFVSHSPDGRRIAMVPSDAGLAADVSELWVVDADSSSVVLRTDGKTKSWSPKWSSDGRTLYYLAHAGSAMSVWAQPFDAAGAPLGTPSSITAGINIRDFAWTVNERRLAYSLGRRIANVYRVPFRADRVSTWADVEQLTYDEADNQCVDLDPTGTKLVVTSDRSGSYHLWTMPASGGDIAPLTSDSSAEWCAAWSPNGEALAFFAYRGGTRDIWTMPAAGGPWKQVTDDPAAEVHPRWSHNGSQIVYLASIEGTSGNWVWSPSGGPARLLGGHGDMVPSPIDNRVTVGRDGVLGIATLDAPDRTRSLPATSGGSPRWTPDGRFLLTRSTANRINIVATDGRSPEHPLVNLGGRPGSLGFYGTPTDGKFVYFIWTEDVGDIWVMDVAR